MRNEKTNVQHLRKKCAKCVKKNHFAARCRAQSDQKRQRNVSKITECMSDEYEDISCVTVTEMDIVDSLETDRAKDEETENGTKMDKVKTDSKLLYDGMLLGGNKVQFQIDCGASCNIIPINLLNTDIKLEHTKSVLVMYNKSKLRPIGKCKVKIRNPRNHKFYRLEFQVVNTDGAVPLLARRTSEAMNLIKVHYENIMATDSIVTEKTTTEHWTMEKIQAN